MKSEDENLHAVGNPDATEADRVNRQAQGRPLTAGMTVLVIVLVVGTLCAASAVDDPAAAASAWLRATGIALLMLGVLAAVSGLEGKGKIRPTAWLRGGIVGWIVLGAPLAVGFQTHFRYVANPAWGGPTNLLALVAIPLGVAGVVTVSHGQPLWIRVLFSLLYVGGALFFSGLVALIVAGLHGDAL